MDSSPPLSSAPGGIDAPALSETRARRITRNFATLSTGQALGKLLAFVITIELTRTLGADRFGLIVFATTMLAYAALLVDFGFDALGPIEISRGRIPLPLLVRSIVSIRLAFAVLTIAAFAIFCKFVPAPPTTRIVIFLYSISLLCTAVELDWVFIGTEQMRRPAVAEVLSQVVLAGGVLLFMRNAHTALRLPVIYSVALGVAALYLGVGFLRHSAGLFGPLDRTVLWQLLRDAAPISLSNAVGMISNNFDFLVLFLITGYETTGFYGAAYRVVWVPTMVVVAYYTALRPSLARASVDGLDSVATLLRRSTRLTAALSLGVATGGFILAAPLIQFLYGAPYARAAEPLRLLLVAFALLVVSRNYRWLLVSLGHQGIELRIMAAAAAVNAALNFLLIPRLVMKGAALANIASEATILIAGYWATRFFVRHVPLWRFFLKPALACAVMVLLLLATGWMHVLLRMAFGGVVYVALLFVTGAVHSEELAIVTTPWKSR